MNISDVTVTLKCLFCHAPLKGPEGSEYSSGDLIKCNECGGENDFSSVFEVAKEEGTAQIKEEVENQLAAQLKDLFK